MVSRPLMPAGRCLTGYPFQGPFLGELMMQRAPVIAVTLGDAAGIGPEVALQAVQHPDVLNCCRPLVIGHPELLERAARLRPTVGEPTIAELRAIPGERRELDESLANLPDHSIAVLNPCADEVARTPAGEVSAEAGHAAFQCLELAAGLARDGIADGIATAPLNKESLQAAGHAFPGHTEILAKYFGVEDFAMMLHVAESRLQPLRRLVTGTADDPVSDRCGLSIAHVTLHTSIASVPKLLDVPSIVSTTVLMRDFLRRLGSSRQAIAVAALNPHGGEHGLFGDEESTLIEPAVAEAVALGCHVSGPLPVDTLIRRAVAGEFDGVIAMYHDQGHIPVKLIGFDSAVNITLGLPVVRTSPTHGTAFDRAWNAATPADASGMTESVLTAVELCRGVT